MNGKGTTVSRQWIVIREVIDDFLNPYSIFRRLFAAVQKSADVGVAAGIDIDAECGNRFLSNGFDRLVGLVLVAFGVWLSLNPREGPKEGFVYSFESLHAVKAVKVSMETVFRKKRGMI